MTIASVRIYFYFEDKELEKEMSKTHWGFAQWFDVRLKPIRNSLRGPEAKGVNIVNFNLFEAPERAWKLDQWAQRANSFNYDCIFNLQSLVGNAPITNIENLMKLTSTFAKIAPWPQVVAVSRALAEPLTAPEIESLNPFLTWPRDLNLKPNPSIKRDALKRAPYVKR